MKAAIVVEAGKDPVYGDFRDPVPAPGKSVIRVTASSLSHVTRARAAGTHYSSDNALPFIPGMDGTGMRNDGQRVYFIFPDTPYGAMAEFSIVDDQHCFALPDGIADDVAAAMAIPAMSSWAALVERANLHTGETVLINGATGASGRLAIQIAKHLGAGKVIATGRNTSTFDDLRLLGADVTIPLTQDRDALENALKDEFAQRVDIVLDYLWGTSAETVIVAAAKAGPETIPIRFVQIGSLSGTNINLPSAALRSSALELRGSGIGSIPFAKMLGAAQGALEAAPSAGFRIALERMPLADVARAWSNKATDSRIVLIP